MSQICILSYNIQIRTIFIFLETVFKVPRNIFDRKNYFNWFICSLASYRGLGIYLINKNIFSYQKIFEGTLNAVFSENSRIFGALFSLKEAKVFLFKKKFFFSMASRALGSCLRDMSFWASKGQHHVVWPYALDFIIKKSSMRNISHHLSQALSKT